MLRISKMADYGTVVMVYLANSRPEDAHNARDIATQTRLALPTVSKILKLLARAGLLVSQRGVKGGYSLARLPEEISMVQVIQAMEGEVGLTECSHAPGNCSFEAFCETRSHWRVISHAIYQALAGLSLAQMVKHPPVEHVVQLRVNVKHKNQTSKQSKKHG